MRRRPDNRITEWREDPTTTERTIAAFVSGAKTRIIVEREARIKGVNGMYVPTEDRIILFRCEGGIPAVSVALEEAGHSQARRDYLDEQKRTERLRDALKTIDNLAPYLIDWYEDGRIYDMLKAEYPGARNELDFVWDLREQHVTKLAWDTKGASPSIRMKVANQKQVIEEFQASVARYKEGNSFNTFDEVLTYLEKYLHEHKGNPAPVPEGFIVPGREGDQSKQVDRTQYKTLAPGQELMEDAIEMTVVIQFDGDEAGLEAKGATYPWHVIRQDEMGGEWVD